MDGINVKILAKSEKKSSKLNSKCVHEKKSANEKFLIKAIQLTFHVFI